MSITFPALKDAEGKLQAKQKELADIFAEADPGGEGTIDLSKVERFDGDSQAAVEAIRALNEEMSDLGDRVKELRPVMDAVTATKELNDAGISGTLGEPGAGGASPAAKRFGDMVVESDAIKAFSGSGDGPVATLDMNPSSLFQRPKATLFETGTGWAPESTRSGLVVPDAQRPVQVTDLIPAFPWSQAAYVYMEETTHTSNAAETAEGGTYGENAYELTEQTSTVRKITAWVPATDEQLEDVPFARAWLEMNLREDLRRRLDGQILVGNGTSPNLEGVNNVTGIQTQAKDTDPTPDAVYKAITKVEVTGRANPDAVIFHPNDWQDIRLLRTSDGVYIWGNPSEAGPERIWGIQVVKSDAQTENTAVVGDFGRYSLLPVRRGVDVQVSNSHDDFFIKGKQAVRADMRTALVFTRPAAFCTVTGI